MTIETQERDLRGRFVSRDPEITALTLCAEALLPLDKRARKRVLDWATDKYMWNYDSSPQPSQKVKP